VTVCLKNIFPCVQWLVRPSFSFLPSTPGFFQIKKRVGKRVVTLWLFLILPGYSNASCCWPVTQKTCPVLTPVFTSICQSLEMTIFQHAFNAWPPCSLQRRILIIVLFSFFGKCYSALLPAASNLLLTSLQSPWQ